VIAWAVFAIVRPRLGAGSGPGEGPNFAVGSDRGATIQSSTTTRTTKHSGGSRLPKPWELCRRRDDPDGEPFGFN
jgi:hypothetical protein